VSNVGFGEVTVLLVLAVIFLGRRLGDFGSTFARVRSGALRPGRERRRETPEPWGRSEWFLVGTVLTLASLSLAIASARR
jgi:hypothetical protein